MVRQRYSLHAYFHDDLKADAGRWRQVRKWLDAQRLEASYQRKLKDTLGAPYELVVDGVDDIRVVEFLATFTPLHHCADKAVFKRSKPHS